MLLFRVRGWKSSSTLSLPIVPLQIHENWGYNETTLQCDNPLSHITVLHSYRSQWPFKEFKKKKKNCSINACYTKYNVLTDIKLVMACYIYIYINIYFNNTNMVDFFTFEFHGNKLTVLCLLFYIYIYFFKCCDPLKVALKLH